ncbi:MAG: DUF1800 family protein [Pyrinomonadaceae bacterium]
MTKYPLIRTFVRSTARFFLLCFCAALPGMSGQVAAQTSPAPNGPVLFSDATSTRAIALDSVVFKREPFALTSPVKWSEDQRTRVMLFAMNLGAQTGDDLSVASAEAEDAAHRKYALKVEYVGSVPGQTWMSAIILRLSDDLGDVGDVLVRVTYRGAASNRVRVGIGHVGGGPADDNGAGPTPAPPTPPTTTTPPSNSYTGPASYADTVRFLEQAAFGPTPALIAHVQSVGFKAFLDEQFAAPVSTYPALAPYPTDSNVGCPADPTNTSIRSTCLRDNYSMYPLQVRFFQNAVSGQDQLRQRVAFALSQIFVTSGLDIQQPSSMGLYQQMFLNEAFGNYRQLLQDVTLSPVMGRYLDMVNNDKPNPTTGVTPNENYAREVLQLFSIGLVKLNQDGTPVLDASGNPVETYDQDDTVEGFAHVFTGWTYPTKPGATLLRHNPQYYIGQMVVFPSNHDTGTKELLDGLVLPAGQSAEKDLNDALNSIATHPNVAPFICKQLIQHLVTSNPSPAYVGRVSAAFNNNGAGVRGDLKAVVTAILLDAEARGDARTDPRYGHLREPALFVANLWRAFNAPADAAGALYTYSSSMGQNIFYSPSVFNFYPPDYVVPNTGVLGPEFGLQTTATALARVNFVNTFAFKTTGGFDYSTLQPLASDPPKLVDALDALLLHRTMSSVTRGVVMQAVSSIPATQTLLRAQTAVYLVSTSSQYQVQR